MSVQPADKSRRLARTFAPVLLAVLMVPMFVGPTEALVKYTSPTQDAQIVDDWGQGAPFGTWVKSNEPAKFWFHGDPGCGDGVSSGNTTVMTYATVTTCGAAPVEGGAPGAPPLQPHWWLDTRQPIDKTPQQVVLYPIASDPPGLGQTLNFDNNNCLYNQMQVMDETVVSGFTVGIDAQLSRNIDDRLRVLVSLLKADCTPKNPASPYIADFVLTSSQPMTDPLEGRFAHFTGSWTFPFVDPTQPYGVIMKKGERLRVHLALESDNPTSSAIVAFDGHCRGFYERVTDNPLPQTPRACEGYLNGVGNDSHFTVFSDSIRVNQWTANRFGEVTNHFPHTEAGRPADVADRTIHWSATAFNTWGHEDADGIVGPSATDPDPYNHCRIQGDTAQAPDFRELPVGNCRKDNLDEQKMQLRVKDVTPGHPTFDQYLPLDLQLGLSSADSEGQVGQHTYDNSFIGCCDAEFVNPMRNKAEDFTHPHLDGRTTDDSRAAGLAHFEYKIVYAQDFPDGVYQVEFQERSKLWRFATQFVVGNTGYTFAFADDEGVISADGTTADHTVALDQATKYNFKLTNEGSVADTFGLAIPIPGSGWTGTVTPTTASLAPGASIEVTALIKPPTNGARPGDIKVVAVAATSIVTNTVETLFTRTTYTTDRLPQTPYLTSPITEVNTRPQIPTVFPLVLHNPGPVQDNYVVTGRVDAGTETCPSEGFVIVLSPTYLPVLASTREGLSVRIQPPTQASPGCSYTLHFQACRSLATADLCSPSLDIPVRIYLIDNVRVSALTNLIPMRDVEKDQFEIECPSETGGIGVGGIGGISQPINGTSPAETSTDLEADAGCRYKVEHQDVFFDDGGLFRILVENNGDREDRIQLSGGWAPRSQQNPGWSDQGECEGTQPNTGDGVPDGWRYRLLPGAPFGTPGALQPSPVDPGMTYPQPPAAGWNGAGVAPRFTPNGPGIPWAPGEGTYDGFNPAHSGVQLPENGPQFGAGHSSTFAGEGRFGWLTLPAHTSQWVYLEAYWVPPIFDSFDGVANVAFTDTASTGLDGPGCDTEQVVAAPGNCGPMTWPCSGFVPAGSDVDPTGFTFDERPVKYRLTRPSEWATFRLSYRSDNDESLRGSLLLTSHLVGRTNDDPALDRTIGAKGISPFGMDHRVRIELGVGQPLDGLAPIQSAEPWAIYNLVATNTGNEYDDLIVSVDDGHNGWKHQITLVDNAQDANIIQNTGIVPSGAYGNNAYSSQPTPWPNMGPGTPRFAGANHGRGCTINDNLAQKMTCYGIGVYDTIYFQVRAIPPSGAAVGSYDDMAITVTSARSKDQIPAPPAVTDKITVRSFVQGTFGFSLLHNNDRLLAYRGQTIAFPFTIRNVGTTNDVYQVFIDDADVDFYKAWNPQLSATSPLLGGSSGAPTPGLIGVPAGYDYHGFVSLTIPTDEITAPITDPVFVDPAPEIRPIRLVILSTQNPLGQSGTIDFIPVVTETPEVKMTVEETSIAGGPDLDLHAGRMRITAEGEGGEILYNGHYITPPSATGVGGQPSLPSGFRFVCLPPTHALYDVERKCYDPYEPHNDPPCAGCTLPYLVEPFFNSGLTAIQQLEVHVPGDQLGTSRVAHRVQGIVDGCILVLPFNDNGCIVTYADGIIDMESSYGVELRVSCTEGEFDASPDGEAQCVIPPGLPGTTADTGPSVLFNLDVVNSGLSPQNVLLGYQGLPEGWQIFFDATTVHTQPPGYAIADMAVECPLLENLCVPLNPLTAYRQSVGVVAPPDAKAGDIATVILTGTVQEDPTIVRQAVIKAVVGQYGMVLQVGPKVEWVAPQDFARFNVVVTNGDADNSLTDVVKVQAFMPGAVSGAFPTSWDQTSCDNGDPNLPPEAGVPEPNEPAACYVILERGESRTIRLNVIIPETVAPTGAGPGYPVAVSAHSVFRPTAATSSPATIKILDYVRADVDGDLLYEYAVDGCTTLSQLEGCSPDPSDGYETFRENAQQAGTVTLPLYGQPDLEPFLNAAGRASWTDGDGKLDYDVDLDLDRRVDHFLDTDNDGRPDVAWLPNAARVHRLDVQRDVTADQLPDYFIDIEGDAIFDTVFDLAQGRAFGLLPKLIDGDEWPDYVIDANGNGDIDLDETILFGGPGGKIARIQWNADVDGNGLLDKAVDQDGDGNPDYFLGARSDGTYADSILITMRDVTGDGVLDWTYDHTGQNGRPDQYYDPVTKKAGVIDTRGQFLRDLETYWFIGLLFLVALALFVVLVMVTRKR